MAASSYGTGQLVRFALEAGCRDLLIGMGGSATTDGGAGLLQALGARLLDDAGAELPHGGAALAELAHIDLSILDPRLREAHVTVLCDVTNPLCGPGGAARVYGPQKGASPSGVEFLDAALAHYAEVAEGTTGVTCRNAPGAGAAGGMGFGLLCFLRAAMRPGIAAVLEATCFADKLEHADLVLTAEGALDRQTLSGKAVAGVARAARAARSGAGVPVIAFAGTVDLSSEDIVRLGLLAAVPLPDRPMALPEALSRAPELLSAAVERAVRLWSALPAKP